MEKSFAIITAGALIALAILFVSHWQISAATGVVYQLNRWTGAIAFCTLDEATLSRCEWAISQRARREITGNE